MQYKKVMYLLEDRPEHRRLVHRYLEVAEYPDGRIELWADGASLPYTTYDRLSEIDQGAVVENKRLRHVLAIAAQVQALRDSRHTIGPSRTLAGEPPRPHQPAPNTKRQRLINRLELERAMAAAPRTQQADMLTLPTVTEPPHSASNSVASGQHHRLTDTPKKHQNPHKKHARADI